MVLGHCVNLSLMPPEVIDRTLALAREADLAFVSMPTPMMYLMDRTPRRTPAMAGRHGAPMKFARRACRWPSAATTAATPGFPMEITTCWIR